MEGIEAQPNLSLLLGATRGSVRDFHWLFHGGTAMVRTRSVGRLVRATIAHLDSFGPSDPGRFDVNARLLVRRGTAVLVDPLLGGAVDQLEQRLHGVGFQVADVALVSVDRQRLEVVMSPSRFEVDADALRALERDFPPSASELTSTSAILPVRAFITAAPRAELAGSAAARLVAMTRLLSEHAHEPARLEDLLTGRRLLDGWEICPCGPEEHSLLEVARGLAATG